MQTSTTRRVTAVSESGKELVSQTSRTEDLGVMLNKAIKVACDFCANSQRVVIVNGYEDGTRVAYHRIDAER
jgi:2-phospho-L-lactate guanylyltransferase (CobY/MobA/RfbA family)